jgi:hypothetical protein
MAAITRRDWLNAYGLVKPLTIIRLVLNFDCARRGTNLGIEGSHRNRVRTPVVAQAHGSHRTSTAVPALGLPGEAKTVDGNAGRQFKRNSIPSFSSHA